MQSRGVLCVIDSRGPDISYIIAQKPGGIVAVELAFLLRTCLTLLHLVHGEVLYSFL